jgi:hypothetical protein
MPDSPQGLSLSRFTECRIGWSWLGADLQVRSLSVPDDDLGLWKACGALGRRAGTSSTLDPRAAASSFVNALQPSAWDTLYKLLRMAGPALAWPDVPGSPLNVVTREPVSRGKLDPSGTFIPTSPDGLIAGFGLPSPAIKVGKRFGFASDPDIHLYLYLDKDAYANDMKYFASGGGIQFGGRTSSGAPLKLRMGVGRDTSGGGAGFITLQIGPDYVLPPRSP